MLRAEQAASSAIASGERLVDAAVEGDVRAFAALYDQHLDRVYRHVFYRVGNHGDAEDLTQEVFLQAWRAIGRYRRGGAPFIAWLLTIAHNLVVSYYRRRKEEAAPLDLELAARELWSNPEAEALAHHDRQAVRRAIRRLKPDHQLVISLRFIEQFSPAEVAAATGKAEGHVRVIQHRALAELRRLLMYEVRA